VFKIRMWSNNKKLLASAAIIGALSSCASIQNFYDSQIGVNRTLPEGSTQDFSNRHAPILNNSMNNNPGDEKENRDIFSPNNAQRRVPVENATSPSSDNGVIYMKPPSDTASAAPVPKVTASYTPATSVAAPSSEAAAVVAAANAAPAPLMPPRAPVAVSSAKNAYPSLASVPPTPATTPKEQSAAELKELTARQAISENGRKKLMDDPNATVMTSPSTGQLVQHPETASINPDIVMSGVPATQSVQQPKQIASAQNVQPQQQANAKGDQSFNSWLHGVFNENDKPAPAKPPVNVAALPPAPPYPGAPVDYAPPAAGEAAAPMEPVHLHPPVMASDIAPATPPAMEPVHLHPPVVTAEVPPPQPMPEPLVVPAAPAVRADATASQMEPVHLHAPGSLAPKSLTSQSPSAEMASNVGSDETVNLVPPAAAAQVHYLPESRYAARRMQSDYNNND
jgi:hypothetical protein